MPYTPKTTTPKTPEVASDEGVVVLAHYVRKPESTTDHLPT